MQGVSNRMIESNDIRIIVVVQVFLVELPQAFVAHKCNVYRSDLLV